MDGLDLRRYQNDEAILDIFSKVVSGKPGYKTIIDKTKPIPTCKNCGTKLLNNEKFCPECGTKVISCSLTNKDCEVKEIRKE
ncbi:MAG: zinc-ribbon domain-containing protein [Candidatus Pacearchaeota archaeon]